MIDLYYTGTGRKTPKWLITTALNGAMDGVTPSPVTNFVGSAH